MKECWLSRKMLPMKQPSPRIFLSCIVVCMAIILSASLSFSESVESLIEEGQAALQEGKEDTAEHKFSEAVSKYPENGRAHFELGNLWMNEALSRKDAGLLQKAIDQCEKAVNYDPSLGDAYDDLAYAHFVRKEYQESYKNYQMAWRLGVRNMFLKENLPLHLYFHERALKTKDISNSSEALPAKSPKTKAPLPSDDEIGGGVGR